MFLRTSESEIWLVKLLLEANSRIGSNQPLADGHLMTVDRRLMAKRLEESNRRLVRSEVADVHSFDLGKFGSSKIQTFRMKILKRPTCSKYTTKAPHVVFKNKE
jgi:hypothetical protein